MLFRTSKIGGILVVLMLIFFLSTSGVKSATQPPPSRLPDTLPIPERPMPQQGEKNCLVPCDQIISGGPDPDGIPPVENPKYISVSDASKNFEDNDVVLGVKIEGQMYGFPYNIMNWHEIVNHKIEGAIMSITYCPLTGTGIPFYTESTLGTSGKLYENNLVYYDRESSTYWSQMYGLAIKGDRIGDIHQQAKMIETNWETFSLMFPEADILSRDTGYTRDYDRYPYSNVDYLNSDAILFQSSYNESDPIDSRYYPKSLSLVINHDNVWGVVPFNELDTNQAMAINHNGIDLVILHDRDARLTMPFVNSLNNQTLELTRTSSSNYNSSDHFNTNLYEDQLGNIWNMKGEAIEGLNAGSQLDHFPAYNAFWFAAMAMFGGGLLYLENDVLTLDENTNPPTKTRATNSLLYSIVAIIAIPLLTGWRKNNK